MRISTVCSIAYPHLDRSRYLLKRNYHSMLPSRYSVSLQFIVLLLLQVCPSGAVVVGNIKIVGQSGGIAQFLPGSYINTIPRWSVENQDEEEEGGQSSVSLKRLIGTGIQQPTSSSPSSTVAQEYVDPTSNVELWWPKDLETIQIRPTLEVFVKTAIPTYLLAGLEVRVPPRTSKDGKAWKNFGMNSQPIASQWTSFNMAVESGFRVESFVGTSTVQIPVDENDSSNSNDENNRNSNIDNQQQTDDDVEWEPLYSIGDEEKSCYGQRNDATRGTADAIETLGELLANLDEMSPLASGMHIVSIPIDEKWVDVPSPYKLKEDEKMTIVSVGTVEPDAMEVLGLDDGLLDMSATSLLKVNLAMIAAGSESQYMPEVYRPLYIEK